MNACINRAVYLARVADYQVDIFIINEVYRQFGFLQLFRREKYPRRIEIDGISIRMFWYAEYYAKRYYRHLLNVYYRHHKRRLTDPEYLDKYISKFKAYDLLCVHSTFGGYLGRRVKEWYGIPYCITWHGSDTHTHPFQDVNILRMNVASMKDAECNYYVSKALKDTSDKLSTEGRKDVLYNGVDGSFYRYSSARREYLKSIFGVCSQKIVAFVGNLSPVKNCTMLPEIFQTVFERYGSGVLFWVIGDGGMRQAVEHDMINRQIPCKFWGNLPIEGMPDIYNCVDVLVLPSVHEGFGLVLVEAITCGANAVGSDADGIPEVIGNDYCVPLGEGFSERFAAKIVEVLNEPQKQYLAPAISWYATAEKENIMYKEIFSRNGY